MRLRAAQEIEEGEQLVAFAALWIGECVEHFTGRAVANGSVICAEDLRRAHAGGGQRGGFVAAAREVERFPFSGLRAVHMLP